MPGRFPFTAVARAGWWGGALLVAAGCSAPSKSGPAAPVWAADSATVRLAAGPQYERGAIWRFFWGAHYRDLWTTPVTVPVLRLATAEPGGLRPLQGGGSYQSRTLRLRTPDARQFVLRSVDKDASAALPAGWPRRLLSGLMKDQTSTAQPYGAYVAAPLAEAAGVLHANPRLVYLPADPGLGLFGAGYANALYLLEERPEGDQRAAACFGHSTQIVNTAHVLAAICQWPADRVAARAYLRARLLDIWLGDWSRRPDQWRWASFLRAGQVTYRPIPRDRDQAFFLFDDGLFTRIIAGFIAKYQSFHPTLSAGAVDGLGRTARVLDRTLLGTLSADDFRQEADSLRRRLSDAAIGRALAAGPAETRAAITAWLAPLLRVRREQLPVVAGRYYKILAAEAWLIGTDRAERFLISGAGVGRVRVQLLTHRPNQADSLLAERIYDRKDTRQLNLYGLAGDDRFELTAPLPAGLAINIYPGAGSDQVRSAAADNPTVTWYLNSRGTARDPAGVTVRPDPNPGLTADRFGWLTRYHLRD